MNHHCGFDFVDANQPWAECSCGAVRTNPMFFNDIWDGLEISYVVFDELENE